MSREQRRTSILLDTALFVKLYVKEQGWENIARILRAAEQGEVEAGISVVTLTEIYYLYHRRAGKKVALQRVDYIREAPYIGKYAVNVQTSIQGGIFKASYKIPIADALIAATALQEKALMVSDDPHFLHIKEISALNATQMCKNIM